MTILDSIIEVETRGLLRETIDPKSAVGRQKLAEAKRVFIVGGDVVCFTESQASVNSEKELDGSPSEGDEALGFEITQKDWETLHSVAAGNTHRTDPLSIDWLTRAGLLEGSAPDVCLTQTAKDWIHGNDANSQSNETRRTA